MPAWEEKGMKIGETIPLMRFLGKRYGFYSANPKQAWVIDAELNFVYEMWSIFIGISFPGPSNNTPENREKWCAAIEKIACRYSEKFTKTPSKFIAGDRLTLPDFWMAVMVWSHWRNEGHHLGPDMCKVSDSVLSKPGHKKFCEYIDRLHAALKTQLESRPAAPM